MNRDPYVRRKTAIGLYTAFAVVAAFFVWLSWTGDIWVGVVVNAFVGVVMVVLAVKTARTSGGVQSD